ncbi:hypothetical protein FB451DRAFT_1167410 [Mycena latifolia]|nr:hypothetical protein FB451DRAFT_1167410 [Mycena latifolia]
MSPTTPPIFGHIDKLRDFHLGTSCGILPSYSLCRTRVVSPTSPTMPSTSDHTQPNSEIFTWSYSISRTRVISPASPKMPPTSDPTQLNSEIFTEHLVWHPNIVLPPLPSSRLTDVAHDATNFRPSTVKLRDFHSVRYFQPYMTKLGVFNSEASYDFRRSISSAVPILEACKDWLSLRLTKSGGAETRRQETHPDTDVENIEDTLDETLEGPGADIDRNVELCSESESGRNTIAPSQFVPI